ncbi:MAG: hypothetical protein A3F31_05500 [Candidatus Levybacteria bacterium RIFCSPHIGHO2_12_FULL_38_12]|nr:MAG: hypothetical protein A3F31_05500 [Candidatus Levybacteria bacterium RIFCSPHIGHO2_12_FULL_38_12]OGH44382.1 MAG: hypothetical protein A3J14_02265 [Candidatus Levybacteria bacterium RIFCSPLOWO2_02_FULL_37_18]
MVTKRKTSGITVKKEKKKVKSSPVASQAYSFKFKRSYAFTIVVVLAMAALAYYFRGLFVAAIVNGKPIFRTTIVKELERQGGKQTLDSLVTEELVFQEANKQKVSVSDDEIHKEIKKIEEQVSKQGQPFDSLLVSQSMTRESLKNRIKLQKLIEKMVGKDIKVTDKEVDDYIEKNKDSIPADSDQQKVKEGVRQQLRQQKLQEKVQSWLSNLQKNAHVLYFVKY